MRLGSSALMVKYIKICQSYVPLKRKFSFSYFRENFAKIYFFAFRENSLRKVMKTFAKTKMYEKTDAGKGKYCEIS
jgi:hypothetical protein